VKKVLGALAALAVVLPLCSMAAETQPRVERHVLLQNGEQIGELGATIAGDRVEIRYAIDDNGRGPKLRESLVLGADGLPARWQIAGTAWVGAPVRETFEKRGGTARWRSNNDAGRAPAAAGTAYLANDASPWILGAYVRAALARPDRTLPVLPGGKLAVEKVRDVAVGAGRYAIYALNGLGGGPTFVMLDDAQRFAGLLQPGTLLLPEGAAADAAEFQRIATTIDAD
jgi:hypothetical protein